MAMLQSNLSKKYLSFLVVAIYAVYPSSASGSDGIKEEVKPKIEEGIAWYDVKEMSLEGKGWKETEHDYDRLPAKAKGKVRDPVWKLGQHSAGMSVRFETDASAIWVRYALRSDSLSMAHMPATGVSGLDLYIEIKPGTWRWLSVVRPNARQMKVRMVQGIASGKRAYTLYLPLYNGVETLEIGVAPDASFTPAAPRREKPILFYGTSITQGGCASRPGMAYPAILGRRLGRPVINLGFSGNGRMDPEVGQLLAELDPSIYVIDCLPNMNADGVAQRCVPLVLGLRKAHPKTPIVLVEDRTYSNAALLPKLRERNETSRRELKKAYQRLIASGLTNLYYVDGDPLLGVDGEATVDGSHPTDLGMVRYADALEPILKRLLPPN